MHSTEKLKTKKGQRLGWPYI